MSKIITTNGAEPVEKIFERIVVSGGWPRNKPFLTVMHECGPRTCYFTSKNIRDEWNTTIACIDEYYWWQISEEGKAKIRLEIKQETKRQLQRLIYNV